MRHALPLILAAALVLPGAALAQVPAGQNSSGAEGTRAGPNQPALSAQPPPGMARDTAPADPASRAQQNTGRDPHRMGDDPGRTQPPPDHRTLSAPAVPGARQPQASTGYAVTDSPVPARPGSGPDASTTGR